MDRNWKKLKHAYTEVIEKVYPILTETKKQAEHIGNPKIVRAIGLTKTD